MAEIIDEDGQIRLKYVKEQSNVLKLQVQSRHISTKVYKCLVKYEPNAIGISGSLEYTCIVPTELGLLAAAHILQQ